MPLEVSVYRKAVSQPDNLFALMLEQNNNITRCIWQQALGVVQMTMCSGKRSCHVTVYARVHVYSLHLYNIKGWSQVLPLI